MKFLAPVLHGLGEPMRVQEVELEDPKAGEVLVRMAASGICHSCLHAQDGTWGPTTPLPVILGDEGSGTVEKVGPGVEHLKPGDHVVISWTPTCGRCHYCVVGRSNLCSSKGRPGLMTDGTTRFHQNGARVHHMGTVATYSPWTVVGASNAIKIRPEMPLEIAALIGCSVTTGLGSVLYAAKVGPGESLAIFGCGGVGLNAIQGGRLVSAWPLIAVDISDEKLELARSLGATHTINPTREDVGERIRDLTGRGLDYAVVTVGNAAATHPGVGDDGPWRHLRGHRRGAGGRAAADQRHVSRDWRAQAGRLQLRLGATVGGFSALREPVPGRQAENRRAGDAPVPAG